MDGDFGNFEDEVGGFDDGDDDEVQDVEQGDFHKYENKFSPTTNVKSSKDKCGNLVGNFYEKN